MSDSCATSKCERISRGLCDCCKQNLCLQHLNEHNALLLTQLNPLIDKINTLGDRLTSFNIHDVVSDSHQELEKWRKDCHEKIDRFFEKKREELDRLVTDKLDRQQKEIHHIQSKVAKLIREQETTRQDIDLLTETIRQLEEEMKKIEKINIQINTRSLIVNESLIQIEETKEEELDLSTFSPVYRSLAYPVDSCVAFSSNHEFLLIHQKPNLCFIDKELNTVKQVLWTYNDIHDICWSSTLDRFIVIDVSNIFLVNERTMSIETIETIEQGKWMTCTCSNTSLFLSTNLCGSSVMELRLSPSVTIIKEWKSPITCSDDEHICGMAYKNKTCGITIKNETQKSVRFELRSCETLDRIWSFPLNIVVNTNLSFHCCSFKYNEWLVIDHETKCLLHITKDGTLKTTIPYNEIPYRANMIASNMLAVSTAKGLNLHKI